MSKKEFTKKYAKELSEKSDVDLIELLDQDMADYVTNNIIQALMTKRLMTVIQDLSKKVDEGNKATSKQTTILILLTFILVLLTIALVILTVVIIRNT